MYTELIYTFTTTHLPIGTTIPFSSILVSSNYRIPIIIITAILIILVVAIVDCRRVTTFARREFPVAARRTLNTKRRRITYLVLGTYPSHLNTSHVESEKTRARSKKKSQHGSDATVSQHHAWFIVIAPSSVAASGITAAAAAEAVPYSTHCAIFTIAVGTGQAGQDGRTDDLYNTQPTHAAASAKKNLQP